MAYDDDDWVGEPPEGRHSRDRADPSHWRKRPPLSFVGGALLVLALVVLALALLL